MAASRSSIQGLPKTSLMLRMRRDAAIWRMAPSPKHSQGSADSVFADRRTTHWPRGICAAKNHRRKVLKQLIEQSRFNQLRSNGAAAPPHLQERTGGDAQCKKPIAMDGLFASKNGAGKEARTLDLYLGKVSLYQLSYSRMFTTEVVKLKIYCYQQTFNLVAWGGIEPPTQGFSILCSTD